LDPSSKPIVPPVVGLGLAIIAVSTSSIFIRFAQTEAPSLSIAAWRLALASLVLVPFAWSKNRAEIRHLSRKTLALLVLSGIFLCFHFATWISSLRYTSVTSSVVLVTTSPVWVALLSPLLLRERLSRAVWAGMGIALIGSVIVAGSDACQVSTTGIHCDGMQDFLHGQALWGNILALIGAWCVAGYLLIGRWVRPNLSLLSYTAIVYGVAALGLLLLAAISGQQMGGFRPVTYLWFVLLAFIPQLIGHSTYNWALRYLKAAYVSVAALGEPIGSSLLAMIFLSEPPTLLEIVGGGITLIGIYFATRASPVPEKTPAMPSS
jgi:drug/metabolite transporter (DMT)-like permease